MNNLATFPAQPYADDDQQLGEKITLLAGQLNAGNYQLLKLIATFDDRKAWSGGGTVRSCAHWLNWKCGIALGAAREKVRVAHCLENLPLIDTAFATGEISYSKVRAMSRVATPENEDFLLTIAQYGTASHVEQVVGKYKNVKCQEDQAQVDQEQARKLVYYQDNEGMWVIHARLPAEAGSLVVKAIEAVATPVQQEQQKLNIEKQRQKQKSEVGKSVSAETLCQAPSNTKADTKADTTEQILDVEDPSAHQDTYGHTRADALVTMAEQFLATSDQNAQFTGLKGSERCQIMLHVDINTLRQHGDKAYCGQDHCDLDDKHWISAKTAKRLSCDASLVTVLEDDRGKVLNIGRRARTVPASIKRALSLRDKTCRVPGCCHSRNLDGHHIRHWVDGGETSLENLVHLCRLHHSQLHRGLFSIHVETADALNEPHMVFSTPSGQEIETSFFPQFSAQSVKAAGADLRDAAPEVNAKTCVTRWRGEKCDYGMAIDALLQRDGKLDRSRLGSSL